MAELTPGARQLAWYTATLFPNDGVARGQMILYCVLPPNRPPNERLKLVLQFVSSDGPLRANEFFYSSFTGIAYQPFSQYEHYLDLVRNEKPIWVNFQTLVPPVIFSVYCSAEPPGEGEGEPP
jgi:hypothetical protein